MTTQFITTRDERHTLDWPDSRHYITTTVLGDLAYRIRKAAGVEDPSAEVQIIEKGRQGGYSEYTQEWSWDFEVQIAGDCCFSTDSYDHSPLTDDATQVWSSNGLGRMFEWLKENEA